MTKKIVRKLKKKVWLSKDIAEDFGGLQADALKNFQTILNSLSVYLVDQNIADTERIVAAICGKSTSLDHVEYAVFDEALLIENKINYEYVLGATPDAEVNKLHIDLKELTAQQVVALAEDIQNTGDLKRMFKKKLGEVMQKGLSEGFYDTKIFNTKLISKIEKYLENAS